jgi:hypothetical protein
MGDFGVFSARPALEDRDRAPIESTWVPVQARSFGEDDVVGATDYTNPMIFNAEKGVHPFRKPNLTHLGEVGPIETNCAYTKSFGYPQMFTKWETCHYLE